MEKIGRYIKKIRKERNMTQQQLAERLNVSFQAISKWETDETLPDTSILLDLANELGITVDLLLNGGVIVNKRKKLIKVENIVNGFSYLKELEKCFGKDSLIYKTIIESISFRMNFDFENALKINLEVLYTEVIIGYLLDGFIVNIDEAKMWIKNDKYIDEIIKRMN